MSDQFNCPNCGAPISGDICPYCGTAFLDWSCIDEKENWIKIRFNGQIHLVKAHMTYLGFEYSMPETTLFADNNKYCSIRGHDELEIHMDLLAEKFTIPGYGKTLMLQIDPEVADLRQVSDILRGAKQNE